ncbi:MAG: type II toxin-antitoxin system MqsA family antitoxin [Candidatus Tectomicrobia bacterium]|uniref:Type II toxin-antitoxin system MqsA family antitoxin n=1 Tax=Tectimicrobiota bacterium TaxID=2528274 RepID=A0A932FXV2_UNCTE|nr:type II toxin-antitoxin system MqsA family antitoxin [Candidatus Tectomicrobia bacterium]
MERCCFCNGKLSPKKVDHLYSWKDQVFLIKGLDAEVCNQCGEEYLGADILEQIDTVMAKGPEAQELVYFPVFSAN